MVLAMKLRPVAKLPDDLRPNVAAADVHGEAVGAQVDPMTKAKLRLWDRR